MNATTKPKEFFDKKMVLINRDFQIRFTIIACFIGVISTALTAMIILYPLYVFEILRIPRFLPMPILLSMFLAILINISMIAILGIYITHRIAGPMYSLARRLRFAEEGQFNGQVFLRQGDELSYLARNMNAFFESLVKRTESDRSKVRMAMEKASNPDSAKILKDLELELTDRITKR